MQLTDPVLIVKRRHMATQLLSYLADIPEDHWARATLERRSGCGSCALGLLGASKSYDPDPKDSIPVREIKKVGLHYQLIAANDGFIGADGMRLDDDEFDLLIHSGKANSEIKKRVCIFLMDVIEGKQ